MSRLRLTKVATPPAPAATKAELFYSLSDSKLEAIDETGKIAVLGGFATTDYRLIRVFAIIIGGTLPTGVTGTNPYTYTPTTTGAHAIYVEVVGGGGAGGGCGSTGSSGAGYGTGGGAGAYSAVFIPSTTNPTIKTSYTISIGSGGVGASNAAGNPGSDTTFDSPSICTAKGGAGGGAIDNVTTTSVSQGALGGAASSGIGDIKFDGGGGGDGIGFTNLIAIGGFGGNSPLGGGSAVGKVVISANAANGFNGCFPGGGGGGSITGNVASNAYGGNGAAGIVKIWEFA